MSEFEKAKDVKPCPFCGSDEIFFEHYDHAVGKRVRIVCVGCMASIDTGWMVQRSQVAELWNQRIKE